MKYHKSKTLWLNFIVLCLSLFDSEFFQMLGINENTTNIINASVIKITAILNIALRVFFTQKEMDK